MTTPNLPSQPANKADDLHAGEVFESFEAGGDHPRATHPDAARAGGERLELRDELGGVGVAGGFAGEDEKGAGVQGE